MKRKLALALLALYALIASQPRPSSESHPFVCNRPQSVYTYYASDGHSETTCWGKLAPNTYLRCDNGAEIIDTHERRIVACR